MLRAACWLLVARWAPLALKARPDQLALKAPPAPKAPPVPLVKEAAALKRWLATGRDRLGRPEAPRLITGGSR